MIIICPRCSTKYKIGKEAITKNGKKVKCTKCKYSWFQENNISVLPVEQKTESFTSAPTWLKWLTLGFLVLTILVSMVVFQSYVTTKFPFTEVIYDKVGLPSTSQLELHNVIVYERGNGVIDVNGFVVNHAKAERRIPTILVNFIDDKGQLITRSIRPLVHYLKPNEKYPFFKMIRDVPKGSRIISVEIRSSPSQIWFYSMF